MSDKNPILTFSTSRLATATTELTFHAGQGLHAKVNKNDLNKNGCLLSSRTIKNIMDYQEAHPELEKINKYNPEVQNLFAKHETPRSILFFEKGLAILYRDFSRDTVSLNLVFETEVPKDLYSPLAKEMIPCLIVDINNKPKCILNSNRKKIPFSDDYPLALEDIIKTNIGKDPESRKIILQSENGVFEWLKSKGMLKGTIIKKGGRLGGGSTTEGGVKLAQDPLKNEWIAVKVLSRADYSKSTESSALEKLDELYGTLVVGEKGYIAGKLYHGMHFDKFLKSSANKDLNNARASIILTLNIMQSLASEMQRIHEKGILQHDIHAANILVDPNRQCVHFVDFGQSRRVKDGDWRILDENRMITQYLQALAFHPKNYLLEELVQEHNKNLFYCLYCFPDESNQFNFAPFIQRLSDALDNKSIQVPKEKMDELEDLRQKYIQQIAMSAKSFYSLIEAENKKKEEDFSFRDECQYISEQSIAKQLTSELEKIKTNIDLECPKPSEDPFQLDLDVPPISSDLAGHPNIDLKNIPKNIDERKKIEAIRDRYLQEFNLIKNNRSVNSLTTQEVTDIFVKYRIIEMCEAQLDQSRNVQQNPMR